MSNSTITRCVLVTLLAFHFGSVCGTAQDASPVRDEAKPVETTQPPAATTAVDPLAVSQMPDISGKWWAGGYPLVIWRAVDGTADFVLESTSVNAEEEMDRVKWSQQTQQFEGAIVDSGPIRISRFTMKLLPDGKTMRVSLFLDKPKQEVLKESGLSESKLDEYLNQEWTRTKRSAGKANDSADAVTVPAKPEMIVPFGNSKMPDISGKWRTRSWLKETGREFDEVEIRRSAAGPEQFEILPNQPEPTDGQAALKISLRWVSNTRQFEGTFKNDKTTQHLSMQLARGSQTLRVTIKVDEATKKEFAARGMSESEVDELLNQAWTRTPLPVGKLTDPGSDSSGPETPTPTQRVVDKMPDIVGTWSRAENGTFSKLTIWPIQNHGWMFFVEGVDCNGLWEWSEAESNFRGFFTFDVLGSRTVRASLSEGEKGAKFLHFQPFNDQRKQLLRSDFAKTERELDQKLRTLWTRVAAPAQPQPKPVPTVTVVKTEFAPAPVRDALRAKYREPPYRFFSNDTFQSVIAIAPEEAQEEIEVLIHKLDVKALDDSFDLAGLPNIAQAVPANQPLPTSRRPDHVVPDITGTWRVAIWYQEKGKYEPVEAGVMEIRRVGAESFLIDQPWVEKAMRILVKWSDANRRFQGVWGNDEDEGHSKITLQPASDNDTTLRVVVTKTSTPKEPLKKGGNEQGSEEKSSPQQWPQEWTRVSLTLSTTHENHIDLTGAAPDTVSHGTIPTRVVTSTALPDTPAAKQLVEQLGAQESAAAAEAAAIRQLQANGQAEQNQQSIAEHQRKLKNLLSTAFDLKLQLEELQVKELQSRLSRLERQIGQRKQLREKIVERRANELIEGDGLKWTPDASRINQDASSKADGETSSTSKATSPPKPDEIVIDLYAGSGVLPGLSQNPKYSRLIQSLNGLKGVVTNIRESGPGATISMAIVRDPSGRLLREIQPNEMASELFSNIHWALSKAGIQNIRWEGHPVADATSSNKEVSNPAFAPSNAPKLVPLRENMHQVTIDFPIANFPVVPGDRIEVQHVLDAEEGFHGGAKTIASGLEVVGVARSLSTPTRTGLTLATTPEMAAMLEHSAATGLLFCHPLDPVAMLPCGRAVRIPLGIRQEGRLTVGDLVQVDRMSLAVGKNDLAEPKFAGFATGLLIGFEESDTAEGTSEPKIILKLLLPKHPTGSDIDAHVFQNQVDELIRDGALFRGKRSERGDATQFHVAVTEIEWQIESLEKRIAYYQAHVLDNAVSGKVQLNLGDQRIRLQQLKAQRELYKTSSDVMARVRPLGIESSRSTPEAESASLPDGGPLLAPAPAVKLLETPPAFNSVVTESATKAREAEATANEAAVKKLIWERLGLKSSGMVFRDQIPKEYRGGMMIEEVDEQRSAFAAGIRKGDILVGLDKWETTSLDNVVFILNHTDTQPKPPSSVVQIKAFLVRGGNTMDTTIEVSGRSPLKPKSEGAGF